jgi:hypothetical protein
MKGWLEGERGRYRLGELLVSDEGLNIYLAAEAIYDSQERYIATFIALTKFDPRFVNTPKAILDGVLVPELPPPQPWPFLKFSIASGARRYKVCQAPPPPRRPLPHFGWYARVKRCMDSLPREVVGPKSRRRLSHYDSGTLLRYDTDGPVGLFFEVSVVDLKPPMPPRSGNFPPKVRRALLEAAGYKCQRCGSTESLQVDHIEPLWEGGEPTFENGQVLCRVCHLQKSKDEGSLGADNWTVYG